MAPAVNLNQTGVNYQQTFKAAKRLITQFKKKKKNQDSKKECEREIIGEDNEIRKTPQGMTSGR